MTQTVKSRLLMHIYLLKHGPMRRQTNKNDNIEKYNKRGQSTVTRKLVIINYGFKRAYLCHYTV
jgi:hypothetical protein